MFVITLYRLHNVNSIRGKRLLGIGLAPLLQSNLKKIIPILTGYRSTPSYVYSRLAIFSVRTTKILVNSQNNTA